MLTSIGRASARRILSHRLPTKTSQLIIAAPALRTAASARLFSVSSWTRLPATAKKAADASKKASTTTANKATAKKKTAAKATTTATEKAKKATPKKTKAAAKPKPKTAPKKVKKLTPEEKEKVEVRQLKKSALFEEPANLPDKTWLVYITQRVKKGKEGLTSQMKELSEGFKKLSESEVESLDAIAKANRLKNQAAYKAWVESQPVELVFIANKARRRLSRKTGKTIRAIRDERQPQRPGSAYGTYFKARFASLGSTNAVEGMRTLSSEWKALSEAERRPFEEVSAAEMAKYQAELEVLKQKLKQPEELA